jgi:hypothetical protein
MNLVLFETTESTLEILWDIAVAFFIVRLAFIYFALTFVSGAALVYLAYNCPHLLPSTTHLVTPQPEVVLAPFLLLSSALWAYVVVSRYEIPRATGFRLAMGGMALLYMVVADAVVGLGLWEEGYGKWMGERVWWKCCGLLAAFALMPTVLMAFEAKPAGRGEERTSHGHGHEEKHTIDAV